MYINFEYLIDKGFNAFDVVRLQAIKQNKFDDMEFILANIMEDHSFEFYEKQGFIEYIKGKKSDSELKRMRLSKKGLKFLEDVETAETEEQDIRLRDWFAEKYKEEDKMIGNKKRIASGIAHFRCHTGIEKNHLSFLIASFISDEDNMQYNNKLENVFFSSKNLYSRKFNIDECRLWTYYKKRENYFNNEFKKRRKGNG